MMRKFSFFLVFSLILSSGFYVEAQSSILGTIYNSLGINRNEPGNNNQNVQTSSTPNNPCSSVFEYVDDGNIIEGEIKLKTSGRDAVVDLVFEANVPGSISAVLSNI